MSRKKVRFKKILRQANWDVGAVTPHGAAGKARATFGREVSDYVLQKAYGKSCCKPMGEEKAKRLRGWNASWEKEAARTGTRR